MATRTGDTSGDSLGDDQRAPHDHAPHNQRAPYDQSAPYDRKDPYGAEASPARPAAGEAAARETRPGETRPGETGAAVVGSIIDRIRTGQGPAEQAHTPPRFCDPDRTAPADLDPQRTSLARRPPARWMRADASPSYRQGASLGIAAWLARGDGTALPAPPDRAAPPHGAMAAPAETRPAQDLTQNRAQDLTQDLAQHPVRSDPAGRHAGHRDPAASTPGMREIAQDQDLRTSLREGPEPQPETSQPVSLKTPRLLDQIAQAQSEKLRELVALGPDIAQMARQISRHNHDLHLQRDGERFIAGQERLLAAATTPAARERIRDAIEIAREVVAGTRDLTTHFRLYLDYVAWAWTCRETHDVTGPIYEAQPDGSYRVGRFSIRERATGALCWLHDGHGTIRAFGPREPDPRGPTADAQAGAPPDAHERNPLRSMKALVETVQRTYPYKIVINGITVRTNKPPEPASNP